MGETEAEDGVRLSHTIFRPDTEALFPCRRGTGFGDLRMDVAKAGPAQSISFRVFLCEIPAHRARDRRRMAGTPRRAARE